MHKSDVGGARRATRNSPIPPNAKRRPECHRYFQAGHCGQLIASHSESRDCYARPLRSGAYHLLSFSLFSFSGNFWARPSPPFERVARGRRAPAAGLCARPSSRRGPHFPRNFNLVEVAGGNPKLDLNGLRGQVRCRPPFLCSTPERGLITAPPVPGTSYPIAGVWGARIWCSGHRTVCTALRPRALVRQALQRPCIELPAVGARPSSLSPTPYPGPSSSPRRTPLTALSGLTPVRLLTHIKALAQGLYPSPRCCIVHRGNSTSLA